MGKKEEKAKAKALEIAMKSLHAIVAATLSQTGFMYAGVTVYGPLFEAGYVETNKDMVNPDNANEIAVRATQSGIDVVNGVNQTKLEEVKMSETTTTVTETAAPAKPVFVLQDNVAMPEVTATKRGGVGRESVYPFKEMQVNQSFFVAATAEKPEPWKTLQSTVANVEAKFAKVKTVQAKNEDGTPRFNADGTPDMVTVTKTVKSREKGKEGQEKTVPVTEKTKTFKIFEVTEGGVKGARIWRTA